MAQAPTLFSPTLFLSCSASSPFVFCLIFLLWWVVPSPHNTHSYHPKRINTWYFVCGYVYAMPERIEAQIMHLISDRDLGKQEPPPGLSEKSLQYWQVPLWEEQRQSSWWACGSKENRYRKDKEERNETRLQLPPKEGELKSKTERDDVEPRWETGSRRGRDLQRRLWIQGKL